jgi:alkylation response protein AidB-like acyl-CoA dehydrogenase
VLDRRTDVDGRTGCKRGDHSMYRLTADQQAVVDKAREVAEKGIGPHAALADRDGTFPREAVAALAKAASSDSPYPASTAAWSRVYASPPRSRSRSPSAALRRR